MKSCLYHGQVRHTRYTPGRHSFRYRLFQFFLDVENIAETLDRLPFCSAKRPALIRFRRRDHLGDAAVPLSEAVRQRVRELGGPAIDGKIFLLTNLRYFGYGFNPVSFYFCYDSNDCLLAVLAEVNNTPWGEQHCYLVPVSHAEKFSRYRHGKEFHVSPFMDLDMDYLWMVSKPDHRLIVRIENHQHGQCLFDAALVMNRTALSAGNVMKMMLTFPFMTLKVIAGIHYEALRLWLKKVPYIPYSKSKEAPAVANK